jgi:hypothetical protein
LKTISFKWDPEKEQALQEIQGKVAGNKTLVNKKLQEKQQIIKYSDGLD